MKFCIIIADVVMIFLTDFFTIDKPRPNDSELTSRPSVVFTLCTIHTKWLLEIRCWRKRRLVQCNTNYNIIQPILSSGRNLWLATFPIFRLSYKTQPCSIDRGNGGIVSILSQADACAKSRKDVDTLTDEQVKNFTGIE